MRLVVPSNGLNVEFYENNVNVLTIENQSVFSSVMGDLWAQYNGLDGEIILSDNDALLKIPKIVECIFNIYSVNCNDKKIITKIYQEMVQLAGESLTERTAEINELIINYLEDVLQTVPYRLSQSLELDVSGLLKLYDVKIETEAVPILENLTNYIKLASKVLGKKIFVFSDIKHYLCREELIALYELAFYEKVYILIIEGDDISHLENEKHVIVDKDLCVIEI